MPDAITSPQGRGIFLMNKKTFQNDFESFLNQNSPEFESEEWIIGGKLMRFHRGQKTYGTALRRNDPIAFNVGFKEYERKFNTRM